MSKYTHTPKSSLGGLSEEEDIFFEAESETPPLPALPVLSSSITQPINRSPSTSDLARKRSPQPRKHVHSTSIDSSGSSKFESIYMTPRESAANLPFYPTKNALLQGNQSELALSTPNESTYNFTTSDVLSQKRIPFSTTLIGEISKSPTPPMPSLNSISTKRILSSGRDFTSLKAAEEELKSITVGFKQEDWLTSSLDSEDKPDHRTTVSPHPEDANKSSTDPFPPTLQPDSALFPLITTPSGGGETEIKPISSGKSSRRVSKDDARSHGYGSSKVSSKVSSRVSSRRPSGKSTEGSYIIVQVSTRVKVLMLIGLSIVFFFATLDLNLIGTMIPTIVTEFTAGRYIALLITAYNLPSTILQPLCAPIYIMFGKKLTYLVSIILFSLGSFVSGSARSIIWLIFARVLAGFGGGMIIPLTYVIIHDALPTQQHKMFNGVINGVFAVGVVLGPIIGGVLAEKLSWRWAFYSTGAFSLVGMCLLAFSIKVPPVEGNVLKKLRKLDWIGIFFLISTMTLFCVGLSLGGETFSINVIALLSAALVTAICFCVVEAKFSRNPLLSISLLRDYPLRAVFGSFFFLGWIQVVFMYYSPVFLQFVVRKSVIQSAIALLPFVGGVVLAWMLSGVVVLRYGWGRMLIVFGGVLIIVGSALVLTFTDSEMVIREILSMILAGIGIGVLSMVLAVTGQASSSLPDPNHSSISALSNFFRCTGLVMGMMVSGAVFNNDILKKITDPSISSTLGDSIKDVNDVLSFGFLDSETTNEKVVIGVILDAVKRVFGVSVIMAAVILLLSLFIRENNRPRRPSLKA
ncbi:680_t:CDS:2 [Paraglomus occultum]|uniref:680_t:CDS:1 n=1 Tax=Paraglomus occultum TaxID=144539 RepID=A0A9N9A4A2_9GLOM|nr:680_t:CDS:2 [Paraglomus occultum]